MRWELSERRAYEEHGIEISARQAHGRRLTYEVALKFESREYTGSGPSLAEALRYLAYQVENARVAGSEYINKDTAVSRFRKCKYCGADFFFAKLPSNSWLPVDAVQVDFNQISIKTLEDRIIRPFHVLDFKGELKVDSARLRGMVWIPHSVVCGSNPCPDLAYLKQRWQNNAQLVVGVEEDTIHGLQQTMKELRDAED